MQFIPDVAQECLVKSRMKVEKYKQSMEEFGASDVEIQKVTRTLVEKNNILDDLLHEIALLREKIITLEKVDKELKLFHFKELGGVIDESDSEEIDGIDCQDGSPKSEITSASSSNNQNIVENRRPYSFLVSQLKKTLRLLETWEFILIPMKTRGRIGRLELNQIIKKLDEVFSEKYVCQKRPPLILKNFKKQESEKLRGRWYISLSEFLARLTAREKVSWKFALPCLIYLKRLEEIQDDNNAFLAAILS